MTPAVPSRRIPRRAALSRGGVETAGCNQDVVKPMPGVAHASDTGATAVEPKRPLLPSLATLLAGHILRDGEVVLLILKPSLWHILFSMMRFAAAVLIVVIAAVLWMPDKAKPYYVEAGLFLLAGRLMWSILGWMGRLYVLTDQRILRLSGVFGVEVFDCPLRKVATTRLTRTTRERLLRLGSIEITPMDDSRPPGVWQTVRKPVQVREQIESSIRKAKSGLGE